MVPIQAAALLAGGIAGELAGVNAEETEGAAQPHVRYYRCDTEPFGVVHRGGGMINDGWDGPGANAITLYWHVENYSPDLPAADQRNAYILALATWASFAQIHFVEIAAPNRSRAIDFRFAFGDHCAVESGECGDPDCPFDDGGDGETNTLAHAAFPPGGSGTCGGPSSESRAGNVHYDEFEFWEFDNAGPGISLALIAAHEVGHAIGLLHDVGPGGPHIMRPTFSGGQGIHGPSGSDIAHLQSGYAAGLGSVTTLEDSGIWVNSSWLGFEAGIPGEPFDTVGEAVDALPPDNGGITIHVLGGLYPETLTISRPCTITAEVSTAYIGQ